MQGENSYFEAHLPNFSLDVSLRSPCLHITLKDYIEKARYSVQVCRTSPSQCDKQLASLQQIFQALKPLRKYHPGVAKGPAYGQTILIEGSKCAKIEPEGVLIVFIPIQNLRSGKMYYLEQQLRLQKQGDLQKWDAELQQLRLENLKLKQAIKCSDQRNAKNQASIENLEAKVDILISLTKGLDYQTSVLSRQKQMSETSKQAYFYRSPRVSAKQGGEARDINVYPGNSQNISQVGGKTYRCSIGKNGVTAFHKEGDGKTPIGAFPLRSIWFRHDRISGEILAVLLRTGLPLSIINPWDGWCDDQDSNLYNRHVDLRELDPSVSHECLWREDNLYDCLLVVGYNDDPVVRGRGSAIFVHVAREKYSGTAGCVAFAKDDLWAILGNLRQGSQIVVHNYAVEQASLFNKINHIDGDGRF